MQMPKFYVARLAVLLPFLSICSHAQWNALNPVSAASKLDDGVQLTMARGTMRLKVCSSTIIRVMYVPAAEFPTRPDPVVIKRSWPKADWTFDSTTDAVTLQTSALKVAVDRKTGVIAFNDSTGKKLFEQTELSLTPVVVNGESTNHAELYSKLWGSYEAFYGLGQHQAGVWNYRGEAVDLSQDNTNISIPFFLSSNGYGIFWNNMSRSRFNNRFLSALYLSSEVAESVDYYFLYGPEFDNIIASYRDLTGSAPLFGKWAYGFWQCKNRYKTQAELLAVARKYREQHIPADNIVQDWFWWVTMGEPVFNKDNYPDPKGMIDTLHDEHFHLMISVWPFFRPGSKTYEDMDRRGFFIDKMKTTGFHPAEQYVTERGTSKPGSAWYLPSLT